VNGTGSGSCPMAGCGTSGVEPSGSATRELGELVRWILGKWVARMGVVGTGSGSCPVAGFRNSRVQYLVLPVEWSRGISIGIAMYCGLDGQASIPGRGKIFLFITAFRLWGPPSLLSSGTGALLPGFKRQGCEADHLTPSSAEAKDCGGIPAHPRIYSWRGA
jgi:hypothetical protein